MHFSIFIDQAAIAQAGLVESTDMIDWAIVNYLQAWWKSSGARTLRSEGVTYSWINFRNALGENPVWKIKTKSSLSKRLTDLESLGILKLFRAPDRSLYAAPGETLLNLGNAPEETEAQAPEVFVETNTCSSERTEVFVETNRGVRQNEQHKEVTIEEGTKTHTKRVCVSDPPNPDPPPAHDPPPSAHAPPPSPPPERELYDLAVAGIRDRCGSYEPRAPMPGDLELIAAQVETLGEVEVRERIQVALATKRGTKGTKADWMDHAGWTISRLFSPSTLQVLGAAGKIQSPSAPAYRPEVEGKRWREEQAELARTKKLASPELIRAGCAGRGTRLRSGEMA